MLAEIPKDFLYRQISVVERDGSRVKIHYEGYNSSYDEWREDTEIVSLSPSPEQSTNSSQVSTHQPYSLYKELGFKIKQLLTCGRKQSPTAKVQMGFDNILFVGGLQAAGTPSSMKNGYMRYKINNFSDLDTLLGKGWHF